MSLSRLSGTRLRVDPGMRFRDRVSLSWSRFQNEGRVSLSSLSGTRLRAYPDVIARNLFTEVEVGI